jgi:hypothetical protein
MPSYRKLVRLTADFIASLRREPEFGRAVNADLRGFRGDLLRAIRAQLQLRRGRRPDPLLDAACDLVKQGKSIPDVLRSQIPTWPTLDPYTRYLAAKGLRQAAARREKHSKRPENRRGKATTKDPSQ